jgi:hypothetical protein
MGITMEGKPRRIDEVERIDVDTQRQDGLLWTLRVVT